MAVESRRTKKDKQGWRFRWLSGSLVSKTILMQMILAIITVVATFTVVNAIVVGHQREKISDLNSSQLWRVGSDVDTRLESIQQSMTQILASKDGISLMVAPEQVDSAASYRIMASLGAMVDENPLLRKVVFYIPSKGEIYSSAGNYLQLDASLEKSAVEAYLDIREQGRNPSDEITYRILNMDGQLFLAGDFCAPHFLGAILAKIDILQLNILMQGDMERSQGRFFVLDPDKKAILMSADLQSEADRFLEAEDYYDVDVMSGDTDNNLYIYHSPSTDLFYGLYFNWDNVSVPKSVIFISLIPFILIYVVFAGGYSLWISRTIYRPINNLMKITMGQREELAAEKRNKNQDELEYLEEVFRDTWGENRQNRELLANISEDVMEQLFRGIVDGKNTDTEYLEATLRGLGLERYIDGRYQPIVGSIVPGTGRELTSMEIGMYRRSLLAYLAEQESSEHLVVSFFLNNNTFVGVLCVTGQVSALSMKSLMTEIEEGMIRLSEQMPYSILIGHGKVCSSMDMIRSSYQEAVYQVEYLRYVDEEDQDSTDVVDKEVKVDNNRQYFTGFGHRLAETAEKERKEAAEQMAESVLHEICSFDSEHATTYMKLMFDAIVEKMIAVHVEQSTMNSLHTNVERVLQAEKREEWEEEMGAILSQALRAIHTSSRRSRYRYVESSKEYISAHYSDGNLSLLEVGDAVGISAPYLSGIFSEAEQIGFAAYLSNYRVEQAKKFLEQTTMNVTEIGYKCGFNSAQSFSRVFKKNTGYTPKQYREHVEKNQ